MTYSEMKLLLPLLVSIGLHLILQVLSLAKTLNVRLGDLTFSDRSGSSSFCLWPGQELTNFDIRPLVRVKQRIDRWLLSDKALGSRKGHDVWVAIWKLRLLLICCLMSSQVLVLRLSEGGCHDISRCLLLLLLSAGVLLHRGVKGFCVVETVRPTCVELLARVQETVFILMMSCLGSWPVSCPCKRSAGPRRT